MGSIEEKIPAILIVDENIAFRNNLATILRLQGFSVEFANGGFHLLHILEKKLEYSLLIIHENMHDMLAEEAISLIRINQNKIDLPILFISQNTDPGEIHDLIRAGANEYIIKTANIQPIIDKAKKYLLNL